MAGCALTATGGTHKRVYRALGLHLPRRTRRRVPPRVRQTLVATNRLNEIWALDLMRDALYSVRRFRTLNVLDEGNREGLAIEVLEHEADPRELIRDYLVQRVEHGVVQNRADVVAALEDAGFEVPRQGKGYVTAHDSESGKRWRLKGALYEHDFNPERIDTPAPPPAGGGTPEIEERTRASCGGVARA